MLSIERDEYFTEVSSIRAFQQQKTGDTIKKQNKFKNLAFPPSTEGVRQAGVQKTVLASRLPF